MNNLTNINKKNTRKAGAPVTSIQHLDQELHIICNNFRQCASGLILTCPNDCGHNIGL